MIFLPGKNDKHAEKERKYADWFETAHAFFIEKIDRREKNKKSGGWPTKIRKEEEEPKEIWIHLLSAQIICRQKEQAYQHENHGTIDII